MWKPIHADQDKVYDLDHHAVQDEADEAYDLKLYSPEEFVQEYGQCDGPLRWRTAKHATVEASSAVRQLRADSRTANSVKTLLPPWVHELPDEDIDTEIFRAFFTPLRWRAQYLQKQCVHHGLWAKSDLSHVKRLTWNHVKASTAADYRLTKSQGRSTIDLIVNKAARNIHLAKTIFNTGVSNDGWKGFVQDLAAKSAQNPRRPHCSRAWR